MLSQIFLEGRQIDWYIYIYRERKRERETWAMESRWLKERMTIGYPLLSQHLVHLICSLFSSPLLSFLLSPFLCLTCQQLLMRCAVHSTTSTRHSVFLFSLSLSFREKREIGNVHLSSDDNFTFSLQFWKRERERKFGQITKTKMNNCPRKLATVPRRWASYLSLNTGSLRTRHASRIWWNLSFPFSFARVVVLSGCSRKI